MKLRPTDIAFSKYVRTRDNWTCQRCYKRYTPPTQALHASHFYGRRKESTRFEPLNVTSHCYGCHSHLSQHPKEHEQWKIKQIGQAAFDRLTIQANTIKKRDDAMDKIIIKELLKDLSND